MTQKHSYFVYHEGYLPSQMTLGSIVMDYANPEDLTPCRFMDEKRSPSEFAYINPSNPTFLQVSTHKAADVDIGIKGMLGPIYHRRRATENIVLVGSVGSKIHLQNPEEYFKLILKSERTRFWLQSRLTAHKGLQENIKRLRTPKFWLLIGIHQIDDATSLNVSDISTKKGAKVTIPIPDPTTITALSGLALGATLKLEDGSKLTSGGKYPGPRVWAAKWRRVEAKYEAYTEAEWKAADLSTTLKLLDDISVGNQRAGDETDVAELSLGEELDLTSSTDTDTDESEAMVPEEYWVAFNSELKDMVDDFEEYEDLLI